MTANTYHFDIVVLIEHDILRLEISVHDLEFLQVLQHINKLGSEQAD